MGLHFLGTWFSAFPSISLADKVSATLDDRKVAVAQSLYTTDNATQTSTKEVSGDENNK